MPKVLTQAQIDRFHQDGFLFPIRVLSEAEVLSYRGRLESFEARYPEHVKKLDIKANLLCPWIVELCRQSAMLDVLEDLLGPDILWTSANIRSKNPHSRSHAGWHQDGKYNHLEPNLTLMIVALTHHTVENGCVRFIPGSHKWGYLDHSETDPDPDSILDRQQHITTHFDDSTAVDVLLQPGQMSVHQAGTIHGSNPNQSDDRRIAWLADFLPAHGRLTSGPRPGAMLVRGVDTHHNFDQEPVPDEDASPAALAAWQRSVENTSASLYEGSGMAPLALR